MASCSNPPNTGQREQAQPTDYPVNPAPFISNCVCCWKNFDSFKIAILNAAARARATGNIRYDSRMTVYSHPATLQCVDCEEGVKKRFTQLLSSMYKISKDSEGYINLDCTQTAAMYLLKGTSVMTHLIPVEYQTGIKLPRR
ncbi:Yippee domain-containing protein [Caenorhabditis elegans]|uniref:Yippee domain-containing protein n=1 Tax=Caenorhabditis elegans TaxID=6239 RepID=Q20746_CAEEL|nr:Yippee domain-containing protein [Caenorhabditis elegans]CAA94143.2 Yippee domain-containing protein [Caenorhabditis elegans]